MTREELMRKIQALDFVKVETELYLDTHPTCRAALDSYYETVDALRAAREEYEAKYAPLTASGTRGERWSWTDMPWPWQSEGTEVQN